MRQNPRYTTVFRPALPFADDDMFEIWQRDPATGGYSRRHVRRDSSQTAMLAAQQKALSEAQASLAAQQAMLQQVLAELAARKTVIALPNVVIPITALINVTAGEKTFANLSCPGLRVTDTNLVIQPVNLPPLYGLRGFSIPAADRITLRVQCPILAGGGTALTFSITAFR